MKKAYIITSGNYSDYHIVAVFSKLSTAEEYVSKYNQHTRWDDALVEEWDIDTPVGEHFGLVIRMSKDGEFKESYEFNGREQGFYCFDPKGNLVWRVATFDLERAIKVVNEKRVQILAMNLWGQEEQLTSALKEDSNIAAEEDRSGR